MMHGIDLTVVWALIIAFAIFGYVVMDGFDLGVGIMFPFMKAGQERDLAINAISPMWDGNETWLVLGGGGLMAAFPTAYAIILPATYPLIIAMLLGLIFRGVAFEFRWRDSRHRPFWDVAFACGSIIAGLSQGIILGAILQGIAVSGDAYAGGWLDWLSPFSVLTGISVLVGYSLSGSTWLVKKLEGEAQRRARRRASVLAAVFLIALVAVSAATPFLHYDYWRRWFSMPRVLLTAQVPVLLVITAVGFFWSIGRGSDRLPFLLTLCFFGLTYIGLGISIFPYAVPQALTIWDAAAPERSQAFLLAGTVFIIPMIIGYTSWAYWVFRGKVPAEDYS
jgi:cytochrome d ubiquinol oxidase subunit II